MCRLMGLTTTKLDVQVKRLFWHQLMLASNADGQRDGVGMTDGVAVMKSADPFLYYGSSWIKDLDVQRVWLGHVRSASRNTEISFRTAHPFMFELDNGQRLYAAHNGYINGMHIDPGTPNVDSYAAFKILVELIKGGASMTPEIINTWSASFDVGSQWAFMFHHQDALTVVRGNREMYYMTLNDGIVFNTSLSVLLHLKEWIGEYFFKQHSIGKIMEIKPYHMCTVGVGSTEVSLAAIKPNKEAEIVSGLYYRARNTIEQILKQ